MSWLDRTQQIRELIEGLGLEVPSCVNCYHFDHGAKTPGQVMIRDEACLLDPLKRRPPAVVIAKGCPSFESDVPF